MTSHEKALDRAAKLKAQMLSEAQLGNEAAAMAFAAAMQRLVLEHTLSDEELEAHLEAGSKAPEEPIIERQIALDSLGMRYKHGQDGTLSTLAGIVGRAHLCKLLVQSRSNRLWFVGTERNIEVSEYMLRTLWRALNTLAKEGLRAAKADAKAEGGTARGYVPAFKNGFITQLSSRYHQERKAVENEAQEAEKPQLQLTGEASTALVRLTAAIEKVDAYISVRYKTTVRNSHLPSAGYHNGRGRRDGAAAADRIGLRANALGSKAGTQRALGA